MLYTSSYLARIMEDLPGRRENVVVGKDFEGGVRGAGCK